MPNTKNKNVDNNNIFFIGAPFLKRRGGWVIQETHWFLFEQASKKCALSGGSGNSINYENLPKIGQNHKPQLLNAIHNLYVIHFMMCIWFHIFSPKAQSGW
jgi:hypothetical protein